ncbi:HAD-IA family hydrolase [Thermodesulfovibrio sp.]|uniref:HAD-IA family hydrolase n=1 Tax=Thermodesulfovibrio sp. TaxID=2067987 RepID=UPI00309FFD9F
MDMELIIFDLDGTLIDSCEDIRQALNYCFEINGGYGGFSSDEVRKMVGEGVNILIEKALKTRKLDIPAKEMIDCFINYYRKHITDHSKLYPQVKETLEALRGLKKAVLSNKLTELSLLAMDNLGIRQYFDFIGGSDTFKEKKPSPMPVLEIIRKFNTLPEKTAIVGDSDIDIKAGKAAGVKTIAVTHGYREREALREADFIIDKLSDILKIIKGKF